MVNSQSREDTEDFRARLSDVIRALIRTGTGSHEVENNLKTT
jgi:hypothetical protein